MTLRKSPGGGPMRLQTGSFDRFRREFNEVRPHEALDQRTPASRYTPSLRTSPAVLSDPAYPTGWRKLRVCGSGNVELRGERVQIHKMLVGELVGLEPLDDERWGVYFGPQRLGEVDTSAAKPRLQRPSAEPSPARAP